MNNNLQNWIAVGIALASLWVLIDSFLIMA